MGASADKISVIIPVFNRRREVLRAIASVLRQTRPADEILIVDDASSDGTAEAVAELRERRIRVLRHPQNRGAAAARNTGIEAAQGDWIAFLDSDDEWDQRKLALQSEALALAPAEMPAGITGYVIQDYRTGQRQGFSPTAQDATLDSLVWGCFLGLGSTLLARRAVFAAVGLLDPDLPRLEDWEWLMRYLPRYKLGVLSEPLAIVHKAEDPSFGRVAASLSRIREKHRDDWYRRSWIEGRKFDSTLLVEEAAARYYARDRAGAALLAMRAVATYPFRGGKFFATLIHRAAGARNAKG